MVFKNVVITIAMLSITSIAAPDFSIMGFASTNGGTTGGKGGAVVTPSTLADLKKYAEDKTTPYVIRITKEFNTGVSVKVGNDGIVGGSINSTYGDIVRLGSNKTLVGIGTSAFFNRIGIVIQCQSNIIIRNIKFTMKDVPVQNTGENKILGWANGAEVVLSDPDCIGIQADDELIAEANRVSKNIWIDHCEFFNEDPATVFDKDRYDGLVDAKNNSTNITISWCYFHDHSKASLMGKGNSDDFDRKITYSHNYFKNIASRLPLVRFGDVHLLNNYMITSENGANARINSDLYIENNYFQDSKKPVFGKVSENGAATFTGNKWVSCSVVPSVVLNEASGAKAIDADEELLKGTFKPSYAYKADPVADVPTLVIANAGVGKISTSEYEPTSIQIAAPVRIETNMVSVHGHTITVNAQSGSAINLYNLLGVEIYSGNILSNGSFETFRVRSGNYILKIGRIAQKLTVN